MAEYVYKSIVVVEMHPDNSVTIESLSVTENECVLSGAWEFDQKEIHQIQTVIGDRLVLVLGSQAKFEKYIKDSSLIYLSIKPFLVEAKEAARMAIKSYEDFKLQDFAKRKKLVAPDFFDWPDEIDLNNSISVLEGLGKMATPHNTPEKMRKTLAASRLLKFLIDMWHSDEQERKNRKYVEGEEAVTTVLPKCWL